MYKNWLAAIVIVLGLQTISWGQDTNRYSHEVAQKRNVAIKEYVSSSSKWNWDDIQKTGGLIHPNEEFKAAVDFLYKQDPQTRPFIKFFTTYDIPHGLRNQGVLTLSFVTHSLAAWADDFQPTYRPLAIQDGDRFIPHQQVPGRPTLWWIDIRDLGWDNDAFEQVVLNDGYFVIPIIDERIAFLLEQEGLSPNIILRASWFIAHAFDAQRQADRGLDVISDILIYSRLNRAPANLAELEALWAVENGVDYTTLVTKSQAVSRHNRVLIAEQGRFEGPFYYTNDVLFQEGARDYLEDLFNFVDGKPRVVDAGEVFFHNQLGLLVFDLFNEVEDRVTFGDPTAVRHNSDITGDVRVRISHSCTDCHASGPLLAENTLFDLLKAGIKIRVPEFDDKADLESSFLGDGFERQVNFGRDVYARAIKYVNGLTPEQNGANYLAIVAWYSQPVTIEQAAIEAGVTPEYLKSRLVGKSSGRLAMMIVGDEPMPRDVWESIGFDGVPGGFQQAMVLVYGLFFKDIKIDIAEADFLNHRKFDWQQKFNLEQDINKFLGIGSGTHKSNTNRVVKPQIVEPQSKVDHPTVGPPSPKLPRMEDNNEPKIQRPEVKRPDLNTKLDSLLNRVEQVENKPDYQVRVEENLRKLKQLEEQMRRDRELREAQTKPQPKTTLAPVKQYKAVISQGKRIGAWPPGGDFNKPSKYTLMGASTWPVFHNSNPHWVGISLGDGEKVFIERSQVQVYSE